MYLVAKRKLKDSKSFKDFKNVLITRRDKDTSEIKYLYSTFTVKKSPLLPKIETIVTSSVESDDDTLIHELYKRMRE